MRPPSSGNAGNRLEMASTTLISASQTSSAPNTADPSQRSTTHHPAPKIAAMTMLIAGPAAAMRNSAPALSASPSSLATPPNSHRVISTTRTSLRSAM